jgi:pimeloyl-ACP methyl ester carboxylesterase
MRPRAVQFTIESDEGLPIRGDLEVPDAARAWFVVVHGFKGFKDWGFFPWLADCLVRAGYAVCRFNMSRSGIGDDPETFDRLDLFADDTYSVQLADLRAAVRYAQSHASLPTLLLGHSRGGGVALLGARDIEHLRGVVTWSAIARTGRWDAATTEQWRRDGFMDVVNARTKQVMRMSTRILDDYEAHRERLDILASAAALRVPLLVIHGGRDESVPVEESAEIAAAAPDAAHVVIGNATHTYNAIHPLVHVPRELRLAAELTIHFVRSRTARPDVT